MKQFFMGPDGKLSMMRLGFMSCMAVGAIMALSGSVAMFLEVRDAATAMATGGGLMGSSGFAKAVQSKWEKKPNDDSSKSD